MPQKRRVELPLSKEGRSLNCISREKKDTSLVGNIYKGRVVKILPGMQSAFVDIGLEKTAFLYVGDIMTEIAE
ncbi:hypothetical protein M1N01_01070 [Thermodesulfovibrionales bacterium]|nr:hypothetical protein [Thermodesulfovibrionales bacterium]